LDPLTNGHCGFEALGIPIRNGYFAGCRCWTDVCNAYHIRIDLDDLSDARTGMTDPKREGQAEKRKGYPAHDRPSHCLD